MEGLASEASVLALAGVDPVEAGARACIVAYVAAHRDAASRHSTGGAHLTVSALVLSPDRRCVLLTDHPKFGRWMQLGGHPEPGDHTLVDVARREVAEESGLGTVTVDPVPLGVDTYELCCPRGVPVTHLDIRFLCLAETWEVTISDESVALDRHRLDALPDRHDTSLALLTAQAAARVAATGGTGARRHRRGTSPTTAS